jgi:hypothetical protein
MFPADAGMNRTVALEEARDRDVPRGRGDEPAIYTWEFCISRDGVVLFVLIIASF